MLAFNINLFTSSLNWFIFFPATDRRTMLVGVVGESWKVSRECWKCWVDFFLHVYRKAMSRDWMWKSETFFYFKAKKCDRWSMIPFRILNRWIHRENIAQSHSCGVLWNAGWLRKVHIFCSSTMITVCDFKIITRSLSCQSDSNRWRSECCFMSKKSIAIIIFKFFFIFLYASNSVSHLLFRHSFLIENISRKILRCFLCIDLKMWKVRMKCLW